MSAALPPGGTVGTMTGSHLRINPLTRKVMSGAASNAFKLKTFMNPDVIIWMIKTVPKKERLKSADEMKWPLLYKAQGALTWIQTVSICKPPIRPQPIALGLI